MSEVDTSPEAIAALAERLRKRGYQNGEMVNHYVHRIEVERLDAAVCVEALSAERDALTAEVARLRDALDTEIKALVAERLSELLEQRWHVAKASERDHLRAALAALKGGDA